MAVRRTILGHPVDFFGNPIEEDSEDFLKIEKNRSGELVLTDRFGHSEWIKQAASGNLVVGSDISGRPVIEAGYGHYVRIEKDSLGEKDIFGNYAIKEDSFGNPVLKLR